MGRLAWITQVSPEGKHKSPDKRDKGISDGRAGDGMMEAERDKPMQCGNMNQGSQAAEKGKELILPYSLQQELALPTSPDSFQTSDVQNVRE